MLPKLADTILVGGVFPTVPGIDSLAISEGRIVAVGKDEGLSSYSGGRTEIVELKGKSVLPGFIDSHTHFLQYSLEKAGVTVDLAGLGREATLSKIAGAAVLRDKGQMIVARGWDESLWGDRRPLGRVELDRAVPDNPVIAVRMDGHKLVLNSFALNQISTDTVGDDIDRESGVLIEEQAFGLLSETAPDIDTMQEALHQGVAHAHRLGITSVHTMLDSKRVRPYMRERGKLKLRVTLYPEVPCLDCLEMIGLDTGFGDEWLRIGGVKLFADGSIGAGNAAVGDPFLDSGEAGALNYSDEELTAFLRRADGAGLQTAVHAIGERAIEQVLQAHAAAHTSNRLRHRIEHFELPSEVQIARARDLGLCISMQPNFVGNWSGEGKMYVTRLGEERDRHIDPHFPVYESGVPLAFGSDCMPLSPLYGLHWAVNAPHLGQRLGVEEAISCYTEMGAYLSFEEERKGRIDVGMDADLVALSADPREARNRIRELDVSMTLVGGEIVFRRGD